MTQERADEIVRKVIYARLTVMPELNNSVEAFNVGRMIGQMQRQLEIELALEIKPQESIERKNKPDVVERSKIDKTITQLEEEKEFAYANFEEYNEEVLSYDDTDIYERDSCYIGLTRAIEIIKRNIGDEE